MERAGRETVPAPRELSDVLTMIRARIQSVLPADWTVELSRDSAKGDEATDARVEFIGPRGRRALFAIEFKATPSRADVIAHEIAYAHREIPTIMVGVTFRRSCRMNCVHAVSDTRTPQGTCF